MSQTTNSGSSASRTNNEQSIQTFVPNVSSGPNASMMPMIISYGGTNRNGQTLYYPGLYPNPLQYGNYPIGFNPYYPIYPVQNNFVPPSMTISALPPPPLIPTRPFLPTAGSYSSLEPLMSGQETERNKNLNIRECQSPTVSSTNGPSMRHSGIASSLNKQINGRINSSASASSTDASPLESESTSHVSSRDDRTESDPSDEDFLTFIERKDKRKLTTKTSTAHGRTSELSGKQLNSKLAILHSEQKSDTNEDYLQTYSELYASVLEKTSRSMEEEKLEAKKVLMTDASVQSNEERKVVHRSTQTLHPKSNIDLIEDTGLRTMKLMDKLAEEFRQVYQNDPRIDLKSMANICDDIRQSILFMHFVAASETKRETTEIPGKDEKPFRQIVEDSENRIGSSFKHPSSSQSSLITGRGMRHLMPSTNFSPVPSFSCRPLEPNNKEKITTTEKLCLFCQKPVDQSSKITHDWCQ